MMMSADGVCQIEAEKEKTHMWRLSCEKWEKIYLFFFELQTAKLIDTACDQCLRQRTH